jgi:hypothetical protein
MESSQFNRSGIFLSCGEQINKPTKDIILSIALPATSCLKFLAEGQEWMVRCSLAVVCLPLSLDPYDPNLCCMNGSWDDAEQAENNINPEVDAKTFDKPDGDRREKERINPTICANEYLRMVKARLLFSSCSDCKS